MDQRPCLIRTSGARTIGDFLFGEKTVQGRHGMLNRIWISTNSDILGRFEKTVSGAET